MPLAQGQAYLSSLGFRTGSATGLAYKQFLSPTFAAEAQVVYRQEGAQLVLTFQPHMELGRRSGMFLYGGVGAHAGFRGLFVPEIARQPVWGVDAIVGFEYVSESQPFAFSFDIKPALEMASGRGVLSGNHAGVTLRYLLP